MQSRLYPRDSCSGNPFGESHRPRCFHGLASSSLYDVFVLEDAIFDVEHGVWFCPPSVASVQLCGLSCSRSCCVVVLCLSCICVKQSIIVVVIVGVLAACNRGLHNLPSCFCECRNYVCVHIVLSLIHI